MKAKRYAFPEDTLQLQDVENALKPFSQLTPEQRKRIYRDYAYEASGRQTRIIRMLPVRDLTPEECSRLLVHSHSPGAMRRKAYLLMSTSNPSAYFRPEQIEALKRWMAEEKVEQIRH